MQDLRTPGQRLRSPTTSCACSWSLLEARLEVEIMCSTPSSEHGEFVNGHMVLLLNGLPAAPAQRDRPSSGVNTVPPAPNPWKTAYLRDYFLIEKFRFEHGMCLLAVSTWKGLFPIRKD